MKNRRDGWLKVTALALMIFVMSLDVQATTFTVKKGPGGQYSTIQDAVDAARTTPGDHIIRIIDSSTYTEFVEMKGAFGSKRMVIEAGSQQTPVVQAMLLNNDMTGGSWTLKGLTFVSNVGKANDSSAGLSIRENLGSGALVVVTNCVFSQAGNDKNNGWIHGVYVRQSNFSVTVNKIVITGCKFYLGGGIGQGYGVQIYDGSNYADMEVLNCIFREGTGQFGIQDQSTTDNPSFRLSIHHNFFLNLWSAYFLSGNPKPYKMTYRTFENNTVVKVGGSSSSDAGFITMSAQNVANASIEAVIKDNLIVTDNSSLASSGINFVNRTPTSLINCQYNAFVAMTDHKVARWGSKLKTLTELHTLTDPDTNQENDTLTPSQLFANYGGNNYQQDYRLRPGVWALTAASDGTYVGAFGLMDLPTVTVVATQPDAAEGTPPTQGTFTVTRQGPTTGNLTVYFTLSGVAAPGNAPGGDYTTIPPANYLAKTGSVVIASGATSATVTVVPLDDNEVEDNETVVLTLQPGLYYSLGSPLQATVYISDNDVRNIAPIVNAGSDQSILTNSLPARTLLRGSATDPDNGPTTPLAFRWSKVSGPGTVTFGNEMQNETTAEFSQAGSYVLQLEADDGADKGSDVVEIAIVSNAAPVVDAGEDMTMTLPMNCTLHGRLIADDGLPGAPSYRWSKVSGPGTVVFAHETSLNTGVRFGQTGVYILQLEANDGMAKGLDTVTVMVRANASFTARTNGRFASADTWVGEAGVNGPPLPGDTAYIANTVVEAITEDEIPDLVTVNIESNGMLRCAAVDVRIFPVSTSATLNVAAGGVLLLGSNQTLSCAVTLSGGTIDFRGAVLEGILNVNSDSFLSVQSDLATIRAQVNGHGRLTLTEGDSTSVVIACEFLPDGTWDGAWDIRRSALFVSDAPERVFRGDVRLAPCAILKTTSGDLVMRGTLSGSGGNSLDNNAALIIGDGTGIGTLSPGDAGPSGGVGTLTFTSHDAGGNVNLVFAPGSTLDVQIRGTTDTMYDTVKVLGNGSGVGGVTVQPGATLVVSLWKAPPDTSLDAVIVHATGACTGEFATVVWKDKAGWQDLSVSWQGSELHVKGSRPGTGGLFMIR